MNRPLPLPAPWAAMAALLLLLLSTASASAAVVDSFEDGAFSLSATAGSPDAGTQVVAPATCIAPRREVTLQAFSTQASADLSLSALDDEIACVFGAGGGRLEGKYENELIDLTAGGTVDRIEAEISVAVPGARLEVELTDATGATAFASHTIGGPGVVAIPFSDLSGVDLGAVQSIAVALVSEQEGDYHLRDISTAGDADADAAAEYVIEQILGGDRDAATIWTHEQPVDGNHVLVGLQREDPDIPLPYDSNWVLMVDPTPEANWMHPVQWVVVNADLGEHTVHEAEFIPTLVGDGGAGARVDIACIGATNLACPTTGASSVLDKVRFGLKDGCLYAVLISGGWTPGSNYSRYPENLTSMYQTLVGLGYAKSQIYTYYADGTEPLDMDNLDGDGNHATGNDVTGGATEANIRGRIQQLCSTMDPNRDVLMIYTSNHGASNGSLMLWDFDNNGQMTDLEAYSPAEMSADTANCQACRSFVMVDQCYSGAFAPMATDGQHPGMAVYAAATASEVSYGREYLDWWEDLDIANTGMNDLHQSVASSGTMNSTPVTAESGPGVGDVTLDFCWGEDEFYIPPHTTFCIGQDEITLTLEICNKLPSTQSYDIAMQGLPAGTGCGVAGPTQFSFSKPLPLSVPAGGCTTVDVTMPLPQGLDALGTSCIQATFTNQEFGYSHTLGATLHGSFLPGLCFELPVLVDRFVDPLEPVSRVFGLHNSGEQDQLLNYQLQVVATDGFAMNDVVSLNGMDPGVPLRGEVLVPAGGSNEVGAELELLQESGIYYDLQLLLMDEAGNFVPVGSSPVRERPAESTGSGPTPELAVLGLEVAPNPFNPRTTVRFEMPVAGVAELEILDMRGRLVSRAPARVLPAGPHSVVWDGQDLSGRPAASGVYLVRVRAAGLEEQVKAVLVR